MKYLLAALCVLCLTTSALATPYGGGFHLIGQAQSPVATGSWAINGDLLPAIVDPWHTVIAPLTAFQLTAFGHDWSDVASGYVQYSGVNASGALGFPHVSFHAFLPNVGSLRAIAWDLDRPYGEVSLKMWEYTDYTRMIQQSGETQTWGMGDTPATPTPEPGTVYLMLTGMVGCFLVRRHYA